MKIYDDLLRNIKVEDYPKKGEVYICKEENGDSTISPEWVVSIAGDRSVGYFWNLKDAELFAKVLERNEAISAVYKTIGLMSDSNISGREFLAIIDDMQQSYLTTVMTTAKVKDFIKDLNDLQLIARQLPKHDKDQKREFLDRKHKVKYGR